MAYEVNHLTVVEVSENVAAIMVEKENFYTYYMKVYTENTTIETPVTKQFFDQVYEKYPHSRLLETYTIDENYRTIRTLSLET